MNRGDLNVENDFKTECPPPRLNYILNEKYFEDDNSILGKIGKGMAVGGGILSLVGSGKVYNSIIKHQNAKTIDEVPRDTFDQLATGMNIVRPGMLMSATGYGLMLGSKGVKWLDDYYRRYKDKPRNIIAKAIARLRWIYQNNLNKSKRMVDAGTASLLRRFLTRIAHIIDKLMLAMQRTVNTTESYELYDDHQIPLNEFFFGNEKPPVFPENPTDENIAAYVVALTNYEAHQVSDNPFKSAKYLDEIDKQNGGNQMLSRWGQPQLNLIKSNAFWSHKNTKRAMVAIPAMALAASIGQGIYKYKMQPKSVIAKKIYSLRKALNKYQKKLKTSRLSKERNILKLVCSKLIKAISILLHFLEKKSDHLFA